MDSKIDQETLDFIIEETTKKVLAVLDERKNKNAEKDKEQEQAKKDGFDKTAETIKNTMRK